MLCRAEKITGPESPLATPERVAVKKVSAKCAATYKEFVEHEGSVLKALAGRPYVPCFQSMHLPAVGAADDHAYLVMG